MIDYDALEAAGKCDCGRSLRRHPPLPRRRPLQSWKAAKYAANPVARPNAMQIASHERFMRLRGDG